MTTKATAYRLVVIAVGRLRMETRPHLEEGLEEALPQGGYEVETSPFAPDAADELEAQVIAALRAFDA